MYKLTDKTMCCDESYKDEDLNFKNIKLGGLVKYLVSADDNM